MGEHKEPIPSRIYNAAVGGHVAGAEDIFDDAMNKDQHTINAEITTGINNKLNSSEKGAVNGVASLDGSGKVPSSQLPSYVDDVIEGYFYDGDFYSDAEHTEIITPESDKIYIDVISNKSYRWTGSVYFPINNPFTPDEEDLTVKNDKIKLADKAYDSASFSGMGRVYLRKNMVSNVNTLTQDMFYKGEAGSRTPNTNTIFIIQYDYTLSENITIPDNCILYFNGGSIDGAYTITGSNTTIVYDKPCLENVDFAGTWIIPNIYSWILKDITSEDRLRTLFKLQNVNIHNNIYIEPSDTSYVVVPSGSTEKSPRDGIDITDNTTVINSASVKIKANGQYGYTIFNMRGTNITLRGGEIIGDRLQHNYTPNAHASHEWGHGIFIPNTSSNCVIDGVFVHDCTGDGIAVSGTNNVIQNVVINYCRRQGITVASNNNLTICNFKIHNIGTTDVATGIEGTAPKAGIDVEPNANGIVNGLIICNGRVYECTEGIQIQTGDGRDYSNFNIHHIQFEEIPYKVLSIGAGVANLNVNNIFIKNCGGDSTSDSARLSLGDSDYRFSNIHIDTTYAGMLIRGDGNYIFTNCSFKSAGRLAYGGTGATFINCTMQCIMFSDLWSTTDKRATFIGCKIKHIATSETSYLTRDNVLFDNCNIYFDSPMKYRGSCKIVFKNCFMEKSPDITDAITWQSTTTGFAVTMVNCIFPGTIQTDMSKVTQTSCNTIAV